MFWLGVDILPVGLFYIKAEMMEDAGWVVNTDKAFDFIGDQVAIFLLSWLHWVPFFMDFSCLFWG